MPCLRRAFLFPFDNLPRKCYSLDMTELAITVSGLIAILAGDHYHRRLIVYLGITLILIASVVAGLTRFRGV